MRLTETLASDDNDASSRAPERPGPIQRRPGPSTLRSESSTKALRTAAARLELQAERLARVGRPASTRIAALRAEARRLASLVARVNGELVTLRRLAYVDELTGLGNLRDLARRLDEERARARRNGTGLGAAMVDVDGFKAWNDRHGHEEGNRVLATLGRVLRAELRREDVAARFGGDEFAGLLPGADARQVESWAGRMRSRFCDETGGRVTLSVGVASVDNGDPRALEGLLGRADEALYRAKALGRGRTVIAAPVGSVLVGGGELMLPGSVG